MRRWMMTGALALWMVLSPKSASAYPELSLFPQDPAMERFVQNIIDQAVLTGIEPDGVRGQRLGEGICRAADGEYCWEVDSFAEGLCRAAKGDACWEVQNLGQGICRAAKGQNCWEVQSLGQGLCRANGGDYCWEVQNIGQAICRSLGGDACWEIN